MSTPHLNKSTACGDCGHAYGEHAETGQPHMMPDGAVIYTILPFCSICYDRRTFDGFPCPAFMNPFTGRSIAWARPVEPDTPCRKCGHPRAHHCTRPKAPTDWVTLNGQRVHGSRTDSGSVRLTPVTGLEVPDSSAEFGFRSYPCQHLPAPCDSTACAERNETNTEFCPCKKFENPYLRGRKQSRGNMTPLFTDKEIAEMRENHLRLHPEEQPPKSKREILIEVVHEFPDATVAELSEASGMSLSWVRKHLKAAGLSLKKGTQ
jgi:hypothetical protein